MATNAATNRGRSGWKELAASSLYHTGMLRVIQSISRSYELRSLPNRRLPHWHEVAGPKFVILCYHRIGSGGVPLYSGLASEVFEAQIRFLQKHYRIISLDELYHEMQNPTSCEQMVAITFDDGYRDLFTHAFPILKRYRVPATVYLTVGAIETGEAAWYDRIFVGLEVFSGNQLEVVLERPRVFQLDSIEARIDAGVAIIGYLRGMPDQIRREWCTSFEKRIPVHPEKLNNCMLTWEHVRAMHQQGISFGSHTMTHPVFSRVPPEDMMKELLESKQVIEAKIGSPVRDFAYPFGKPADYGPQPEDLLRRCGYRTAVTTTEGINTTGANLYALRRTQIGEEQSVAMFVFQLNQLFLYDNQGQGPDANGTMAHAEQKARRSSDRREFQG